MAKSEGPTTFVGRSYEHTTLTYAHALEELESAISQNDRSSKKFVIQEFQKINPNITGDPYDCGPCCTLNRDATERIQYLFKTFAVKACAANMNSGLTYALIACAACVIDMGKLTKDVLLANSRFVIADNKTTIPDFLSELLQREECDSEVWNTIVEMNDDSLFARVLQAIAEGEIVTRSATINACLLCSCLDWLKLWLNNYSIFWFILALDLNSSC